MFVCVYHYQLLLFQGLFKHAYMFCCSWDNMGTKYVSVTTNEQVCLMLAIQNIEAYSKIRVHMYAFIHSFCGGTRFKMNNPKKAKRTPQTGEKKTTLGFWYFTHRTEKTPIIAHVGMKPTQPFS